MRNPSLSHAGKTLSRKERRLAKKRSGQTPRVISNDFGLVAQLKKAEKADASGQLELAAKLYADLLDLRKDSAIAQFNAANFFQRNHRPDIAYMGFKCAVVLEPENVEFWERFGRHLSVAGQHEAAVIAYERTCALKPCDPERLLALANAHALNSNPQQALVAADKAVRLRPDNATGHFRRGVYLGALGNFEESHQALYRALQLDPGLHGIYYRLVRTGAKIENAGDVTEKLKATLADGNVCGEEYTNLLFAVARLEEQLKNYDTAFDYFLQANRSVFDRNPIPVTAVAEMFDACTKGYDGAAFEKIPDFAHTSEIPVFIVGMPRSGTTLVEQVIASHSRAEGAGELNKIYLISKDMYAGTGKSPAFRDPASDQERLRRAGDDYLTFLKRQAEGEPLRITDKMPTNFMRLGLIKTLFPNAAVIHCRRTALDTCLSCFTTHFGDLDMMGFSYDLEILGRYYREYKRIMAHWHSVLPGQIFDVDYENLIDNPQAVCRGIIEHIGLDWQEDCLEFHKNRRNVQTASAWQVRQPLYASSVGRWQHYEKYLAPLRQALACDQDG